MTTDVGAESADDAKADGPEIAFTAVDGLALRSSIGKVEEGRVIRSATSFKTAFGTNPPADLDFTHDWLAVYSAGTRATGGYAAAIDHVRLSDTGLTVKVTSHLTTPGAGCLLPQIVTKPFAVVKFPAQAGAARSRFTKLSDEKSCSAGLCDADLQPVLEAQVAGMTYMSESDYPLTYVSYGTGPGPTGMPLEERSFADTFDHLTTVYDPNDPYLVDYAAKYQALRTVLEQNLTNLRVVRIGEISIDVYILGETSCGELVGLKTTSIET